MQNKFLPMLLAAACVTYGLRAEESASTANAPAATPQTTAPAQIQTAPVPNQIIYAPRLPSPTELTNVATAQGMTVEQINQTSNQITVIYKNASGQTTTVAYQLLPASGTPASTTTVVVPSPAPTVVYQTTPSVVYQTAPSVVYYDSYPYWPRYYYPPVSLSLGFGYYRGWGGGFHGGYRGGFHHWR